MRKLVTVLTVIILIGTLLVGAVVGQEKTNAFESPGTMGVQLTYPGSTSKTLSYRGDLTKFYMNVENLGGYEIKVNADKEVSGDTGYFITWLDKEGFTIDPWENSKKFTLYVLARFDPEPDRTEEIDITITIKSGIYHDSMTFHVVLVDNGVDLDIDESNSDVDRNKSPVQEIYSVVSAVCSKLRSVFIRQ